MTVGIYIIRNKINNKIYVGKSINIERRWKQYDYDFRERKIKHINQYLLNSMIRHGYDNFEFVIQEECCESKLFERELFWMNYFKSYNRDTGYNLRVDTDEGMKTHDLTRQKISNRLKSEWDSGIRDLHSDKLKESWNRGDRDRNEQSERMSNALTKYLYLVTDENNVTIKIKYKQLKQLKLHGVLGEFMKKKCDKVKFKNYIIERIVVNE